MAGRRISVITTQLHSIRVIGPKAIKITQKVIGGPDALIDRMLALTVTTDELAAMIEDAKRSAKGVTFDVGGETS